MGNFIGGYCCARHFHHGADNITNTDFTGLHNFFRYSVNRAKLVSEFFSKSYQWNHDLWIYFNLLLALKYLSGSFENSPSLHFCNFRIENAEATSATTQHRIFFVESFNSFNYKVERNIKLLCELASYNIIVRQELMQWRIEQTNSYRSTIHSFK